MIGKIIRWVFAVVCLAVCAKLVLMALAAEKAAVAAAAASEEVAKGNFTVGPTPLYVLAALALLAGVFLASPDTIGRLAGAIGQFFTGFIFPEERNAKPELTYTLARFYVQEERFSEAVEEYKKIIHYYPDERDAYSELLAAAVQEGDMKTYHKYARILKHRFNCEIEMVYADPEAENTAAAGPEPPPASASETEERPPS